MSLPNNNDLLHRLEFAERKQPQWQKLIKQDSADDDPFIWTIRDILTLLLIFFIVMYTNASSHTKAVPLAPPAAGQDVKAQDASYMRLKHEVDRFMAQSSDQGFSLRWDKTSPVFVLGERITFEEGQADLLESFQPTLKHIAVFISTTPGYRILVSGHTDNAPIHNATYPSNWELSAARAARVARFLCENGVNPTLVAIHGYAEYNPLYENSTPELRQANRRVEITLASQGE